jgi:hypothetical protein
MSWVPDRGDPCAARLRAGVARVDFAPCVDDIAPQSGSLTWRRGLRLALLRLANGG